jgi:hypothetical protein
MPIAEMTPVAAPPARSKTHLPLTQALARYVRAPRFGGQEAAAWPWR